MAINPVDIPEHSDDERMACMQRINEFFQNHDALEKAAEQYYTSSDMTLGSGWNNQTFSATAVHEMEQACVQAGGDYKVFTGTLDCIGVGEFTKKMGNKRHAYTNAAQCFPPVSECDGYRTSYSSSRWWIDMNWVMEYYCRDTTSPTRVPATSTMDNNVPLQSPSRTPALFTPTKLPSPPVASVNNKNHNHNIHSSTANDGLGFLLFWTLLVVAGILGAALYVKRKTWFRSRSRESYPYAPTRQYEMTDLSMTDVYNDENDDDDDNSGKVINEAEGNHTRIGLKC